MRTCTFDVSFGGQCMNGWTEEIRYVWCEPCNGNGSYTTKASRGIFTYVKCEVCNGSGKMKVISLVHCKVCKGTGNVP